MWNIQMGWQRFYTLQSLGVLYDVCVVDQEPRGDKTAIEQLEHLKAVFSEEGADGVGEKLYAMDAQALRILTSAAKLPLRAGGKVRSVAELRSMLQDHVASALGADDEEQAGNLHHSPCRPLSEERVQYMFLCSKT